MTFKAALPLIASFLILLLSLSGKAHHSSAIYDDQRTVRLQGTVVRFKWTNPHIYIDVVDTNAAGADVVWVIEGLPPTGMSSGGWSRDSLELGEHITVEGNPARISGRLKILGQSVIKENGTILEIPSTRRPDGPQPVDLPNPLVAVSLSGRWATRWNSEVVSQFMRPQNSWSLTEKGLAAMDSYNASLDPGIQCTPEPSPYVMIWPSGKSLDISDGTILIADELGVQRTVHMDVGSHVGALYSDQGHSIGRWEDDVLVVDTTHFLDHRRGLAFAGLPSGIQKHLVERFELSQDKTTLQYSFWLEDPDYLLEPVTGQLVLVYRPDRPFVMEPCDLDSAGRHMLN